MHKDLIDKFKHVPTLTVIEIQPTNDIYVAFDYPPTSFKVNNIHPTKTKLHQVCCKMDVNAIGVACVDSECFEFGWSTLNGKESEWNTFHDNLQR